MPPEPQKEPQNSKNSMTFVAFLVVIVILLSFSSYLLFPNVYTDFKNSISSFFTQSKTTSIATEVQIKQTNSLLATSQIAFSKVKSVVPSTLSDLSQEMKEFILNGNDQIKYQKIQYENGKTGLFISYLMKNTDIQNTNTEINKNIISWFKLNNTYSTDFGFTDYNGNNTNVQARLMYFQNGKDVKVTIKTESK